MTPSKGSDCSHQKGDKALQEAERQQEAKLASECLIGISPEEYAELQAEEVITSKDHVVYWLGGNGHFNLSASSNAGADVPPCCHTHSINTNYCEDNFNLPRDPPPYIGTIKDKETFSKQCSAVAVEDLLIKTPCSGNHYMIPTEMIQYREAIQLAIDTFHRQCGVAATNEFYCYMTAISLDTPSGSHQSFKTIHADGLMGQHVRDVRASGRQCDVKLPIFFSISSALPTEYFIESVDISHLDLQIHDVSKYFDRKVKDSNTQPYSPQAFDLTMWDGYTLHRSGVNNSEKSVHRTFLRLEFCCRMYDAVISRNSAFEHVYPPLKPVGRLYMSNMGGFSQVPIAPELSGESTPKPVKYKASQIVPITADDEENPANNERAKWQELASKPRLSKVYDEFPLKGLTMNGLLSFVSAHYDELCGKTTSEVCSNIIVPLTTGAQMSLVDLVEVTGMSDSDGTPFVGLSTVFISHAWSMQFLDVVEAMKAFEAREDQQSVVFWFDTMSVNQHNAMNGMYDSNWYSTTFKTGISRIGKTCMVLSPWDNPKPLTRSWCLWELLCTVVSQNPLYFQMVPSEIQRFEQALVEDLVSVQASMIRVDMRNAQSYMPVDKERIDQRVGSEVGFTALNSIIGDKLRAWVCEASLHTVNSKDVVPHTLKLNTAQLLKQTNRLAEAEAMYREVLSSVISSADDHSSLHRVKLDLSDCLRLQGESSWPEAKELCLSVLNELDTTPEADMHLQAAQCLATVVDEMKDYHGTYGATSMYRLCLSRVQERNGESVGALFLSMQLAVSLWHQNESSEEAGDLFVKTLAGWEKHYKNTGERHSNMFFCMGAYASFLRSNSNINEAVVHCRAALNGRVETLGKLHPLTLRSHHNMAELLLEVGTADADEEAKELVRVAAKGRREVLGDHADSRDSEALLERATATTTAQQQQ